MKVQDGSDEEGWNLKGQTIQLKMDIITPIEKIKTTLAELLGGNLLRYLTNF